MIKAFLFDYDGVITKGVDNEWVAGRLSHNLDIPIEIASGWMKEIWLEFLKGTISEDGIWKGIEEECGKAISAPQRDIWFTWEEVEPLPEMIDLVRALREGGYMVVVVSNVFGVTKELITGKGGYDAFDFVVASCDLKRKKPEPEIFQATLQKLGTIKPEEAVFLDDGEANVRAAEAFGFTGVHVTDQQEAARDVKSLLAT